VEHSVDKVRYPQEHWKCYKPTGIPGGKRVLKAYRQATLEGWGKNDLGTAGGSAEVVHVTPKGRKNGTKRAQEYPCTTQKKQKLAPNRNQRERESSGTEQP
jgi:hypothetical protein